jgi:hypothetical protein
MTPIEQFWREVTTAGHVACAIVGYMLGHWMKK